MIIATAGHVDHGKTSLVKHLTGVDTERLEDDRIHGPVLYVHPPSPTLRALRGVFPLMVVPEDRLELRLEFGMLWSAAPAPEEAAEADGVIFEVGFEPSEGGEAIILLPKTTCIHDGSLEAFFIDAGQLSGRKGRVYVSIFAGRTGVRDDAAFVTGKLFQVS